VLDWERTELDLELDLDRDCLPLRRDLDLDLDLDRRRRDEAFFFLWLSSRSLSSSKVEDAAVDSDALENDFAIASLFFRLEESLRSIRAIVFVVTNGILS
jgi:hypothetical protein